MKRSSRNLIPTLGALVITLTVIAGCEDSGIVGTTFLPPNPSIIVDTLTTLSIEPEELVSYAGSKAFVALGRYEDQLFGTYEAVAMLTPNLISPLNTLLPEYRYGIVLRPVESYGDTLSTSIIDVYEIQQRWRAQEWRMDDAPVLGSTPITRFEIGNTDSVFVELPQSWVNEFLEFHTNDPSDRDSIYQARKFGLAFVPVSGNKISYLSSADNMLLVEIPDTTSVSSNMRQRASNYKLVQPPLNVENGVILMNDFTRAGKFSFRVDEDIVGAQLVTRAEIVFYEDRTRLNSTLPFGHTRYSNQILRIFDLDASEKEFYVTKSALTTAVPDTVHGIYRFNVTNLVNSALASGGTDYSFYVTTDLDNGIIRPNLIHNLNAGVRAPRLIITRVEGTR